jgi:hypothetical protein
MGSQKRGEGYENQEETKEEQLGKVAGYHSEKYSKPTGHEGCMLWTA